MSPAPACKSFPKALLCSSSQTERTAILLHHPAACNSTFVGTPCWMAPEVMDPARSGYDSSADIWSFGITLLELATGAPPLARKHPMRVLLTTMQEDPPTLADVIADRQGEGAPVFSKAMHDIVAECLSKCACERPTATQLLQHKFFKVRETACGCAMMSSSDKSSLVVQSLVHVFALCLWAPCADLGCCSPCSH